MDEETGPSGLTLEEALVELHRELDEMRADDNRNQLPGMKPDDAFEMGYEMAIKDLVRFTSEES